MEKQYYSYEEFRDDVKSLAKMVKGENIDAFVGIARGGLTLTHALTTALDRREVYSINAIGYEDSHKLGSIEIFNIPDLSQFATVLLIDDIVDSGETIEQVLAELKVKYPELNVKTLAIFYKESATHNPDFTLKHADCWIEFFWEKDYLL